MENMISGCDVSHWQGLIDWKQVKNDNIGFAIIKSSEGDYITDSYLGANITGCQQNDIPFSVYHYLRANTVAEAVNESNFFLSILEQIGFENLGFMPFVDVETIGAANFSRDVTSAMTKEFIDNIESKTGIRCGIYSFPYYITNYMDERLAEYDLWIASYTDHVNMPIGPWSKYWCWQYSDKAQVKGIGIVDGNKMEAENLHKLSKEDANKLIAILQGLHSAGFDQEQAHYLANEVRKAAGLPTT